ncbi:Crp/Fnr family transcriptional regulator [Erythrobacter litoralis]|uniref:Crp/Fnr family transcriptional regulator n=1 Tax=Erythrobacter litoralis TaxID=39960 RepID=UPI002435BB84|nr:Crp/Fnr family transcriptional regulator [Erythrobacter litoralis]MDG6077937.1 Crp/Fnr family transcriptional regulator [Erythrobacter litoralis]
MSENPRLGYDVIWLAAKEGTSLEQHLVSLGQRNAKERVAYLAVWLMDRARATGLADRSNRLDFAITQTQISDMLGLSLVHTNRTIRALDQEGIVIWRAKEIDIPNFDRAAKFADYESSEMHGRPFI